MNDELNIILNFCLDNCLRICPVGLVCKKWGQLLCKRVRILRSEADVWYAMISGWSDPCCEIDSPTQSMDNRNRITHQADNYTINGWTNPPKLIVSPKIIHTYLIGYPYIIHNIYIKKKNIIDKTIIDDILKIILNFCADDHKSHIYQVGFNSVSEISQVNLVCKKWDQLIGAKIKQLRMDLELWWHLQWNCREDHSCRPWIKRRPQSLISYESNNVNEILQTTELKLVENANENIQAFSPKIILPHGILHKYLLGYPYIVHNIHSKKKNIIGKTIIDDVLKIILNFCADDYNSNTNQVEFSYNSKISQVDLVCKKWNQLISPKIKHLRTDFKSWHLSQRKWSRSCCNSSSNWRRRPPPKCSAFSGGCPHNGVFDTIAEGQLCQVPAELALFVSPIPYKSNTVNGILQTTELKLVENVNNIQALHKIFSPKIILPPGILHKYLLGYPYVIHNIYTKKKNIIDKIITNDDALGVILNFCTHDNNSVISQVDLVCKKWSQLISPKIKQLRMDLKSQNSAIEYPGEYDCECCFGWLSQSVHTQTEWRLIENANKSFVSPIAYRPPTVIPPIKNTIVIDWKDAMKILMNQIVAPRLLIHPDGMNQIVAPRLLIHPDGVNQIVAPRLLIHPDKTNTTINRLFPLRVSYPPIYRIRNPTPKNLINRMLPDDVLGIILSKTIPKSPHEEKTGCDYCNQSCYVKCSRACYISITVVSKRWNKITNSHIIKHLLKGLSKSQIWFLKSCCLKSFHKTGMGIITD